MPFLAFFCFVSKLWYFQIFCFGCNFFVYEYFLARIGRKGDLLVLFDAMPLDNESLIALHGRSGMCPGPGNMLVSSQWLKKALVVHLSKSFLCTWLDFFCSLWWFLYLINWTIRFFFIKKIKKCSSALFETRTFRCVSWPVLLKIQVEIVT